MSKPNQKNRDSEALRRAVHPLAESLKGGIRYPRCPRSHLDKKDKKKNKKKKMNVFETEVQMKEDLQAPPSSEYQPLEEDTEVPVQGLSR